MTPTAEWDPWRPTASLTWARTSMPALRECNWLDNFTSLPGEFLPSPPRWRHAWARDFEGRVFHFAYNNYVRAVLCFAVWDNHPVRTWAHWFRKKLSRHSLALKFPVQSSPCFSFFLLNITHLLRYFGIWRTFVPCGWKFCRIALSILWKYALSYIFLSRYFGTKSSVKNRPGTHRDIEELRNSSWRCIHFPNLGATQASPAPSDRIKPRDAI